MGDEAVSGGEDEGAGLVLMLGAPKELIVGRKGRRRAQHCELSV